MERIKKRLETALNHLMLAENEVNRLKIMKKPTTLSDESLTILAEIEKISAKIKQ